MSNQCRRPNERTGKNLRAAAALFGILLLSACNHASEQPAEDILFHRFVHVDATGWLRDDTITITLPAVDSLTLADATLQVRAGQDFPFTTLRLRVLIDDAEGLQRRLVDVPLYPADAEPILKESPTGIEADVPLGEVLLKPGKASSLRVCHAMRQQSVPGLRSVGVRLNSKP